MSVKEIPVEPKEYFGLTILVDNEDFEHISQLNWHIHRHCNTFYSMRHIYVEGKRTCTLMHRDLLGLRKGDPNVDHIDGDELNNQNSNIRLATTHQNGENRRKSPTFKTSSKYKSVCWYKAGSCWRANIKIHGKSVHLGLFDIEENAAREYNAVALKYFGEFAKLNERV
jgi:hypothetical protein